MTGVTPSWAFNDLFLAVFYHGKNKKISLKVYFDMEEERRKVFAALIVTFPVLTFKNKKRSNSKIHKN